MAGGDGRVSARHVVACDTCGWKSLPSTPGHAARSYRVHSCQRHLTRAAKAAAHAAKLARIDRTPKPCHHPYAQHQHGTRVCYVMDRCRCQPCTEANREQEAARARYKAYGQWNPYVDAEPAREHVRALMAAGMGWKRIADKAGVSTGGLSKLMYGASERRPSRRIRQYTEQRILAIAVDVADGARVDATGTRRRLQALVAQGWTQTRLAELVGISPANFGHLIHAHGAVNARTARTVRDLYDQLWKADPAHGANGYVRGGISKAKACARRRGWVGPLAWDDDTIDDPNAAPDLGSDADVVDAVAQRRRAEGDRTVRLTRAQQRAAVRDLLEAGHNRTQIAAALGMSSATVNALAADVAS